MKGEKKEEHTYRKRRRERGLKKKEEESVYMCADMSIMQMSLRKGPVLLEEGCHRMFLELCGRLVSYPSHHPLRRTFLKASILLGRLTTGCCGEKKYDSLSELNSIVVQW